MHQSPDPSNFVLAQEKTLLNPPLGATFVVNAEPHTGSHTRARPTGRFCVGLTTPTFLVFRALPFYMRRTR
jgi:hypothetical protein